MTVKEAVATLNVVNGKHKTIEDTRFRLSTSGMFSPEKLREKRQSPHDGKEISRRTSDRLQSKRMSQTNSATGKRVSSSVSDDGDAESPVAKPKRKTTLKSSKTNDKSPLKKHGYDMKMREDLQVNLRDSPAKNTRSKIRNPLDLLAKANLPVPESLAKSNKINSQPEKSAHGSAFSSPAATNESRKRRVGGERKSQGKDHEERRNAKRVKVTKPSSADEPQMQNDLGSDAEQAEDDQSKAQDDIATPQTNGEPKKKTGRPPQKNKGTEEEQQARTAKKAADAQARREADEADRQEFERFKALYVENIQDAIQINNCTELWSAAGGAACLIKAHTGDLEANSARGKSVMRSVKKLRDAYRDLRSSSAVLSDIEDRIEKRLPELEGRCKLLTRMDQAPVDEIIVNDMYVSVIPTIVILLKDFLRGRCNGDSFEGRSIKELTHLLDLAINVCNQAQTCQSRPPTLEREIERRVNSNIRANLERIRKSYEPERKRLERVEEDLARRQRLSERQKVANQKIKDKDERAKGMKNNATYTSLSTHHRNAAVIDQRRTTDDDANTGSELHDKESGNHASGLASNENDTSSNKITAPATEPRLRRPILHRESTVELPPPMSVNLSDEEKMALLNGLQTYTGEYRYTDILNDHELGLILKKRDLDDLMEAARSFSQMMASTMGSEVYRADSSFAWLWTTEPDIQENRSIVL